MSKLFLINCCKFSKLLDETKTFSGKRVWFAPEVLPGEGDDNAYELNISIPRVALNQALHQERTPLLRAAFIVYRAAHLFPSTFNSKWVHLV